MMVIPQKWLSSQIAQNNPEVELRLLSVKEASYEDATGAMVSP